MPQPKCSFLMLMLWFLLPGLLAISADKPAKKDSYALPFGHDPYLPSQAQSSFEGFLEPSDFPSASYCGTCHEAIHSQWRQSAHANSFRADFYLKNVQLLIDSKGIEYTRHCEGCHNPIALFTGSLTRGSGVDRSFDEDGITCSVCHSIEKIQNTSGTGSYVLARPAVMVDANGKSVKGLPTFDDILARPDLHRKAVMRPFYRTSEFCSVCHKAALPKEENGYRWLRMFSVYDEWQNSSWSKASPLPFYEKPVVSTCQTCHMPREKAEHDYTAAAGTAASHRWLGANTAIPSLYRYQEQLDRVSAFLKTALKVDLFGLEKQGPEGGLIAPLGTQAFTIKPGETVVVDVLVQNVGIGHNLVPEQRDFYECWVEFSAQDAAGKMFFRSGALDSEGMVDPESHSYTNRLVSGDGKWIDMHQVWQTKTKAYDNSIPAGRSDLVRYKVPIPAGVAGPITLTAKVNYRRFRRSFTNFIFPDQRSFPVVVMATSSGSLDIGNNPVPKATDPTLTMFRWNNYGISLLTQQQYAAAQEAFAKVIRLNPKYADGYINLAVAKYSTLVENKNEGPDGPGNLLLSNRAAQQFDPALELLEKALRLNPESARALLYKGVILRHQARLNEAAGAQTAVLRQFPRSRQARQELGYDYFLLHRYSEARAEFEALQSINPDDLTAHYYLGIIYGKLGMKSEAERESLLYAEHREDPTMGSLVQDFWRANPGLVNEITPYHIHEAGHRPARSMTVGGFLP